MFKYNWLSKLNFKNYDTNKQIELAIKIDNYDLYKKYLEKDIGNFQNEYLKENFIDEHKLFKASISRIYIGNEFCHNLFPEEELLINMLKKAKEENLEVTLCFTYMRENYIGKTKEVLNKVYSWCKENNKRILKNILERVSLDKDYSVEDVIEVFRDFQGYINTCTAKGEEDSFTQHEKWVKRAISIMLYGVVER